MADVCITKGRENAGASVGSQGRRTEEGRCEKREPCDDLVPKDHGVHAGNHTSTPAQSGADEDEGSKQHQPCLRKYCHSRHVRCRAEGDACMGVERCSRRWVVEKKTKE